MGLCKGVTVFCGFSCIKVKSSEQALVNTVLNIWEFHKRQGISYLAERPLACTISKATLLISLVYTLLLLLLLLWRICSKQQLLSQRNSR
jgi:hypothetical protein